MRRPGATGRSGRPPGPASSASRDTTLRTPSSASGHRAAAVELGRQVHDPAAVACRGTGRRRPRRSAPGACSPRRRWPGSRAANLAACSAAGPGSPPRRSPSRRAERSGQRRPAHPASRPAQRTTAMAATSHIMCDSRHDSALAATSCSAIQRSSHSWDASCLAAVPGGSSWRSGSGSSVLTRRSEYLEPAWKVTMANGK